MAPWAAPKGCGDSSRPCKAVLARGNGWAGNPDRVPHSRGRSGGGPARVAGPGIGWRSAERDEGADVHGMSMLGFEALWERLRNSDESVEIEAKRAEEVGKSIAETVSAFSNEPGRGGGYFLLG